LIKYSFNVFLGQTMKKAMVLCACFWAAAVNAQGSAHKDGKSGDAGYRKGCSAQLKADPCSRACWESWNETQKQRINQRCDARKKQQSRQQERRSKQVQKQSGRSAGSSGGSVIGR
jgi:hypothetical protein